MVPGESRDGYGKAAPGLAGNLPCMAGQTSRRETKLVEFVLHSGGSPESVAFNCERSWPILGDEKKQA
jgi:hypothetical protein